ncbi:MAG: SOS response-associated peptidase [Bacteroidota bacterium]|nr:SOS response-associated peptidase [Bacteroidota bacterium]
MCGRYSFAIEDGLIKERFGVTVRSAIYKARYNCAPSQNLAVITNEEPDVLNFYRWGLIPYWAKDPVIGNKLINAKAETILEKPSFKNAFRSHRCLVLSDGFFEWKKNGKKIPFYVTLKGHVPFAMAGIWDRWRDPAGSLVNSFSIITTVPNSLMAEIHDRMPVILERENEKKWLANTPAEELVSLLRPYPNSGMTASQVSDLVNSPKNDNAEIIH